MTKKEYNKIDNTYFLIEEKTKEVLKQNNIDFYDYSSKFLNILNRFFINKHRIEVIKNLDFNNKILTRAVLNRAFFSSKEDELKNASLMFEKSKKELFEWLDKTENPYFFILNPVYKYGAGLGFKSYFSKNHGYKKIYFTGVINLELASQYALYKINK